eukprot:4687423-Amphidinium_carterae.1
MSSLDAYEAMAHFLCRRSTLQKVAISHVLVIYNNLQQLKGFQQKLTLSTAFTWLIRALVHEKPTCCRHGSVRATALYPSLYRQGTHQCVHSNCSPGCSTPVDGEGK